MASTDESVDPDLPIEEFRRLGYRTVDLVTEYYASLNEQSVYPSISPDAVVEAFDEPLPSERTAPDEIIDLWEERVLPNATYTTSPRFFGHVIGSGTMMGALAELVAAATNMNAFGWTGGPSATEVERRCIRWLGDIVGYPDGSSGLLTSGGTMANVTAILTALRNTAEYDTTSTGLQTDERSGRFTIYLADHEGHPTIVRAADMLNLGREAVRWVPSDDQFRMDVEALEYLLDEDMANGDNPFCVVGQVGSVNVSAIDPLDEIARISEERDLWFHADGACGAVGAMLPELADRYDGLDRADSVTLDPHKWLFVPYECGAVLVRHPDTLLRSFAMGTSYLSESPSEQPEEFDYFEYGPQLSRGFRALKLWTSFKRYGTDGYRALLRKNIACAEHLDTLARSNGDFETFHEPNLFIYSFRYAPADLQATLELEPEAGNRVQAYMDELNQAVIDEVVESGLAFLTTTTIRGRRALRLSICSHRTTKADIEVVFEALSETGARLDGEWRDSAGLPV